MPRLLRLLPLLLAAVAALPLAAQTVVRTVPVPGASDLVVDAARGRLIVGVGATYTSADGLVALDPVSGALSDRLPVEGGAARLALSDDGGTLYAGLSTFPSVARFDVEAWREVSRFSLGVEDVVGARYANDLVLPAGQPDVVVVARRARAARPSTLGVAAYEDGVERADTYPEASVLERGPDGQLYGFDGLPLASVPDGAERTSRLAQLVLTTTGVDGSMVDVSFLGTTGGGSPVFGVGGDFALMGSRFYGSNGAVVDIGASQFVGAFSNALWGTPSETVEFVAVRPLPDLGRVALLARYQETTYLAVFDAATRALIAYDEVAAGPPFRDSDHTPRRFERWSATGLAYVTDGAVVLIESAMLAEDLAFAAPGAHAVDFGTIDGVAERPFVVRNTGTAPLRVDAVEGSRRELSFSPSAFELAPGEALEGVLRVTPAQSDSIAGTLTFVDNGVASTSVAVSAVAEVPTLSFLRREVDFQSVPVGQQASLDNVVFNNRVALVTVTAIRSTDPRFSVTLRAPRETLPFTIGRDRNQVFDIAFTPDAEGPVEAQLIIESDAYAQTDTLQLRGTGAAPTAGEDAAEAADALGAPFPNPATGDAQVRVSVARGGPVRLTLHDALGRQVAVLLDDDLPAGARAVAVPAGDLPPGLYLVRLRAPGFDAVQRLSVVR